MLCDKHEQKNSRSRSWPSCWSESDPAGQPRTRSPINRDQRELTTMGMTPALKFCFEQKRLGCGQRWRHMTGATKVPILIVYFRINTKVSWVLAGGRSLLDRLPLLLLETTVNGLSNRRLHQVNVAHHQWNEEVLQVFVEHPVAQVSCRRQVSNPVKLLLTSARQSTKIKPHKGDLRQQRYIFRPWTKRRIIQICGIP